MLVRDPDSDTTPDLPDGADLPANPTGMKLHHIGVAVKSIRKAVEYYVGTFGFRKASETLHVPTENVRVCMIEAPDGVLIELVEGLSDDSPVKEVLSRPGAGPYHLCYEVPDLDATIERLRSEHCFLLKRFDRPAYGHRRFAFLLTPDRQLFELCERDESVEGRLEPGQPRRYTFRTLFYEVTRTCDLACPICMAGSNDKKLVRQSRKQELNTEEIERYILASAHEIGVETITWSGGEFMLRPDALELVRRATDHGYSSTVASNGKKLDRDKLQQLQEASDGTVVVAVGINSIDDENTWTRNAEHSLAQRVLRDCEELGIRRHVVVTVGKHNLETLEHTLAWLEENNIPYNRSPYTARNSGREFWSKLHFDRDDMERTIHPSLRKRPHGYISYTPFFLSPELHERVSKGVRNVTVPQEPSIGCWCGTWLGCSAEGDVAPCAILLDEVPCGNVREKSFQRIIDESPVFQLLLDRELLQGKCGRCRYKFTCGGCRAMAFFENGDIMGEDPTCFFEPEDESTVCEHEEETNRMFRRYAFMVRQAERARTLRVGERKPKEDAGS